ncbi:MAG: DUF1071 domain-containing protein [Alphaproteobacteria bacterium]|nr:DUF1071 domain-containing protein [Alphaproteobacteria bacterium]
MEKKKSLFSELFVIDVNEHTEKKKSGNGRELTYLSWAWAYAEFVKRCPDMTYEIKHWDGKPYLYDEDLGYMVETSVTANGETKTMWLPVMDGANKAMKNKPYTYETKYNGQKTVEAATMFDINTTIMRCLVKNFGMFGLGLYIYAGEDLPETPFEPMTEEQKKTLLDLGANFDVMLSYLKVKSVDEISKQQADTLIEAKRKQVKGV